MHDLGSTDDALRKEIAELRERLEVSEETLRAIHTGMVDAITVDTPEGVQVFTLKGAEQPYRVMVEAMSEGAVTAAPDGVILYCNQRFADMVKADLQTIMGSSFPARFADDDATKISAAIRASQTGISHVQATLAASDATRVPVNVAMHSQGDRGARSVAIVVTDLAERQREAEILQRSNRALRMINTCNQIIIHANDESRMLADACQAMVDVGGYRLAWVGYADHDEAKSIRSVAHYVSRDHVEDARVSWADTRSAQDPAGTAIRTGRMVIARDTQTHPGYEPWRRMADANGYRSSAAIPLRSDHQVLGALTVYSGEPDAFDEMESLLLAELTDNLAFGLGALRTRHARNSLADIVESAGDAIVGRDLTGTITTWNDAATRIFGYTEAEAIGRPIEMLVPSEIAGESARLFARLCESGVPEQIDTVRLAKDGRRIPIAQTYSPLRDGAGRIVGAAIIARDITDRRRAEAELVQHRRHLEELVAARTAELANANQALEGAIHQLETFAYSVSHDLRAPLRAIDGFSLILQEDYADKLDTEGQRLLQVVRDGATRMEHLIDDILAFSRIGRSRVKAADTDMAALVQDTLHELAPAMAERAIDVTVGPLPHVHGDRQMLQRVWMNLLANAIKFTAAKPKAAIEVGARAENGETIFFVKDNGAGFDMRYVGRLFGVFERLHGQEEFSGTGIGLAIVKLIVTRHGGRVWADGKLGEGATFWFALPEAGSNYA